ncbi:nuclease-related domain-containing protein [Fictibacillus aquaticus]|uniref:NERD domain-containing protein n=1 Tax=Fictibacillus aquaticus TaxID=2021314 RepID=A0A235F7H3_9BACL|nr:nuclease-related domain-containing protein [Fictibacillus aquaticus]OYD57301.1 hypothetical protein CGZ90_11480 [Fictibacillus aquaticus]
MVTILKKRYISLKILKLEALLRRLPLMHKRRVEIEEDLSKSLAGYRGELALNYDFKFLKQDFYYVLEDLRLQNQNGDFFQIDCLLLSPTYFLILEAKNMSGSIMFNQHTRHMIHNNKNGLERSYSDPLLQVQRQRIQLENWLKHHKCPFVPVETQVVLSNSDTRYDATTNHNFVYKNVTSRLNLPNRTTEFEAVHTEELLSHKAIKQISKILMKRNTPYNPNLMEWYSLKMDDLILGVFCPNTNCPSVSDPMVKVNSGWRCRNCLTFSRDAHIIALHDYVLLFGEDITNSLFRKFVLIESVFTASRLLKQLVIPATGAKKNRKYKLSLPKAADIL